MSIGVILLIAVSLSMDAFSFSLIYGTLNLTKNKLIQMSLIVGIFHFIMPLIGYKLGEEILKIIKINPDILVGIILLILGIEMLFTLKKEEKVKIITNIFSIILFAFTVSIDSFSIGISFGVINTNILIPCIIFATISSIFAYIGLILGRKISFKFGNITLLIGSIILIILGINYLI